MIRPFVIIKSAFTLAECKEIVDYAKSVPAAEATIGTEKGNVVRPDFRTGKVHWIKRFDPAFQPVCRRIEAETHHANAQNFGLDIRSFHDIQISEYNESDKFNWHQDTRVYPNEPAHTPFERRISVCVQLTPRNSYEGGDFWVDYNGEKQIVRDFSDAGDMLIFDGRLFHKVAQITSGTRHSLVAWWWGPRN